MDGLVLANICVDYGARRALEDVSLHAAPGRLVALLGPNGAGKSTLLRVAGGWLRPTSGSVTLQGEPFPGPDRRRAAQRLAAVGTEAASHFPYGVREVVAMGRYPWRGAFGNESDRDRAVVDRALARTALTDMQLRTVSRLSAGERQRVRLARCLAQDAQVALFDEPTAHLDWRHAYAAVRCLRDWAHDEQRAVVAVLHDLNLAARFADDVALLAGGRLVAKGAPADVLTAEQVARVFDVPVHVTPHPEGHGPVLVQADADR